MCSYYCIRNAKLSLILVEKIITDFQDGWLQVRQKVEGTTVEVCQVIN